jgi:aryl-alcohol dehydrogenase-like predicted oxidoreductase
MEQRALGNSGLNVSALGLGYMELAYVYGKAPTENDAITLVRRAYDEGITFFDMVEANRIQISLTVVNLEALGDTVE